MIIYKVTNRINGMSYIGQTIFDLDKRKAQHMSAASGNKDKYYFHSALRKYGIDNFNWDIIEKCGDIEELNRFEIYYIGYFDTYSKGYNMTIGGNGMCGFKHTEESKKKISENHFDISDRNNPMFGKRQTKETRQKISEAKKGKTPWNKGKHLTESLKGENHHRARSIILIHLDGTEEQFNCMTDACRKYNLNAGHLTEVAKGKRKYNKGYKCKYNKKEK